MKLASDAEFTNPGPARTHSWFGRGVLTSRRALSLALITAGACLLGYVGAKYIDMYRTQQNLQNEWRQQTEAAYASGGASSGHLAAAFSKNKDKSLSRLQIPKIKLDAIVLEGAAAAQLSRGPGHMGETASPGEAGNAVITAHRDTFFRHIFELNNGDEVLIQRNGQTFRYRVTGKKIVDPDDLSVIQQTPDAELTLITCYPTYYIGPAPQRLVVTSKLEE